MKIYPTNYNCSHNYQNSQVSHTGGINFLNKFNPISRYTDKYFYKMAALSTDKFEPENRMLAGKIKQKYFKNLSAWEVNPDSSEKYILFLHGMAQNVSNYQHLYEMITGKNMSVFAVEYRGYGINGVAKISEDKLCKDVENAYNYLVNEKRIKPENITVIGHSMGGTLAAHLAAKHPDLKALVLICPIVQMVDLGPKFVFHKRLGLGIPPFVKKLSDNFKPLMWFYNHRFNSIKKIKKINTQIYYIQSIDDSVTTIKGARKFVKAARKKGILKYFKSLPTGGHKVDSDKISAVSEFLEKIYN